MYTEQATDIADCEAASAPVTGAPTADAAIARLDGMQATHDPLRRKHGVLHQRKQVTETRVPDALPRWSSRHLTLVLISAAALGSVSGCGNLENNDRLSRDVYASIEACKADWGNPGDCEEVPAARSASGTHSFYGPRYYSRSGSYGYTSTARPGSRSSGTVSSSPSRGGFGASASAHGGSSSSGHSSGG